MKRHMRRMTRQAELMRSRLRFGSILIGGIMALGGIYAVVTSNFGGTVAGVFILGIGVWVICDTLKHRADRR